LKSAVHAKKTNGVLPAKNSRNSSMKPKSNIGHLKRTPNNITSIDALSFDAVADDFSKLDTADRNSALMDLQKTHGNQYVQKLAARIQAKLKISQPRDIYEQEADRMAERILRMPDPVEVTQSNKIPKSSENLAKNEVMPSIMPYSPSQEGINNTPSSIQNSIHSQGQPLDSSTLSYMESRFGRDFSQVRIHNDSVSTSKINAQAFTKGNNIVFGQGKYQPGTHSGKSLLAHELTHVIQQSENKGKVIQRKAVMPEVKTVTPVKRPTIGKNRGIIDLKGKPIFDPPTEIAKWLDEQVSKTGTVNVAFGKIAHGPIEVQKVDNNYRIKKQKIPLFHPIFTGTGEVASGLQPSLILNAETQNITGYITLASGDKIPGKDGLAQKLNDMPEIIGLKGISFNKVPSITNELKGGSLYFGIKSSPIVLGGFSGFVSIETDGERITSFKGTAQINVKGLANATLELARSPEGVVSGKVSAPLNLKKLAGNVEVGWDGQTITGIGVIGYQGEKLSGNLTVNVMEESKATQLEQGNQPPSKEDVVNIPKKTGKPKYVVFGSGELTFAFTNWLNGNANVILDSKGNVTIIGQITPQKEIELFPQKDYEKKLFKVEARASYGIPVVGNIFIFANVGVDAFAKVGPAKFYKIVAEGTYSTDPLKSKDFKIRGSLNVSAAAGLRLRGEAGAGLEILAHDIKAGAGINGLAGIRGYAEATPVVGYREKAIEGEDKKGEFFISGDLEIAAQPFLGLSGDLFVEIDAPFWSPVPDKKWTWPLAGKEWPIGGSFGINASVDYVFGSNQWPNIEFKPVEFSADKFLTDLYSDKAKEKSGAKEKPGTWKERNSKDADPPKGSIKGDVRPSQITELPPAKPRVRAGQTRPVKKSINPNAKTATGKTVGQYEQEARRKGLGSKKRRGDAGRRKDKYRKDRKDEKEKVKKAKEKPPTGAIKDLKGAKAVIDNTINQQLPKGASQVADINKVLSSVSSKLKPLYTNPIAEEILPGKPKNEGAMGFKVKVKEKGKYTTITSVKYFKTGKIIDKDKRWEIGKKGVEKYISKLVKHDVSEKTIKDQFPRWETEFGFTKLSLITKQKPWVIYGEMSPSKPVTTVEQVDDSDDKLLKGLTKEYKYDYVDDRATKAYGTIKRVGGEERKRLPPKGPGYYKGDHRGHLIGDRFGGAGERKNLVPMHPTLNLSTFKSFENEVAEKYKEYEVNKIPALINVKIQPNYSSTNKNEVYKYYRPHCVTPHADIITVENHKKIDKPPITSDCLKNDESTPEEKVIILKQTDAQELAKSIPGLDEKVYKKLENALKNIKIRNKNDLDKLKDEGIDQETVDKLKKKREDHKLKFYKKKVNND